MKVRRILIILALYVPHSLGDSGALEEFIYKESQAGTERSAVLRSYSLAFSIECSRPPTRLDLERFESQPGFLALVKENANYPLGIMRVKRVLEESAAPINCEE